MEQNKTKRILVFLIHKRTQNAPSSEIFLTGFANPQRQNTGCLSNNYISPVNQYL